MAKRGISLDFRKKFGSGLASDIVLPEEKLLWLPSRSLPLNYTLGGGIPYGRMMELIGFESTGKSLLALDFGVAAQKLGGAVLWVDAEGSFTNYWATLNGLDTDNVEVLAEIAIEKISDWAMQAVKYYRSQLINNEPIVLVIDSLAALDSEVNMDAEQSGGKAEMGKRAKQLYQFLRLRGPLFERLGVCTIMINQVRAKLGAGLYEAAETTPGGKAPAFYASQRVFLVRGKQIKYGKGKEERKIGQNVSVRIQKNKVSPPKLPLSTQVHFLPDQLGYVGFHRDLGLDEILVRAGTLVKSGNAFEFEGEKVARGIDHFYEVFTEDKNFRRLLIKKSPINTISKTQKKMRGIAENLYPVNGKEKEE